MDAAPDGTFQLGTVFLDHPSANAFLIPATLNR